MEVLRTRLCAWEPIGIDAIGLAQSAASGAPAAEPRLAVGRSNGAVELWDTTTWHMHSTSMGCDKRCFRGIAWGEEDGQSLRLFTAGLHGEITEWDLSTLDVRSTIGSGGGAIWAFCAFRQKLLAACEDGSVRVFSTDGGDDELYPMRRIVVGQKRLLSIAPFGTNYIFVGGSDSKISKWSLSSGTCEARMTVEKAGDDQETLVWALATLGDHGIASGDSLGVVTIWDPVMCVVLHRFVHHQADVLSLASSRDGNILISAGIDAVVSTYCRQTSNDEQWCFRNSDVGHTRDVRAVALDIATNGRKQIVSGGVSGTLLMHTLQLAAAKKRSKPLQCGAFSPHFQRASLAEDSRLVMCQRGVQLELHYLQPPQEPTEAIEGGVASWPGAAEVWPSRLPESQLLVRHSLSGAKDGHHVTAAAITRDGKHFAASDISGTRLFHLSISELEVRRERKFPESVAKVAARALLFCGESLLVIAAWRSHKLHIVDVQKDKVTAAFAEHSAPITLLASTGEWLASGDASGSVHLYNLDSLQHQARVPAGSSQEFPTALSFDAAGKCLLIALSTHKVLIYDIEAQALAATVPSIVAVPTGVLPLHERICSITTLPGLPRKLILAGHDFMLTLDLEQLALSEEQPIDESAAEGSPTKKRRGAKKISRGGASGSSRSLSHISDAADMSPCVWRTYSKMSLRHIFGIWSLDRNRWGKPVLQDHFLQPGSQPTLEEEDAGTGSKKRGRVDISAMLLTVEVAPETVESALPPAFEKKKFLATH